MAQNTDLIEFIGDPAADCNCAASEFVNDFVAKTNGDFITSLSSASNESIWTPYTFTLGTSISTTDAVLTVQGAANTDAKIEIKGGSDTTTIIPNSITSPKFTSGSGLVLTNTAAILPATIFGGHVLPSGDDTRNLGASGTEWAHVYTDDLTVTGTSTLAAIALTNATLSGNLIVNGNTTLGNASDDTITITGTPTITPAATLTGGATFGGHLCKCHSWDSPINVY
jgi:hypothetical protein